MKVKQLLAFLETIDPEKDIYVYQTHETMDYWGAFNFAISIGMNDNVYLMAQEEELV